MEDLCGVPACVANFEDERVLPRLRDNPFYIRLIFVVPLEGNRKLDKHGTEMPPLRQRVEARFRIAFIGLSRSDRFCRRWFFDCHRRVRKCSVQLGRENEVWIHSRYGLAPSSSHCRSDMPVKRAIDLDQVEELREIFKTLARWKRGGIDDAGPVILGPSRYANL